MTDCSDLFDEILQMLDNLSTAGLVAPQKLQEAIVRLRYLKFEFSECMKIHDEVHEKMLHRLPRVSFDENTGGVLVKINGKVTKWFSIPRARQDTPVKLLSSIETTFFTPGAPSTNPNKSDGLEDSQVIMSGRVEAFYSSASLWWEFFEKQIAGRRSKGKLNVIIVRNNLIIHADKTFKESSAGISNSFGTSSDTGPVVKALRLSSQTKEFQDAGLKPNVIEMLLLAKERILDLQSN